MLRSATTSYYQADGLGSITSLSSGAGSLAQTYTFDSFGNQTASSGSLTNPFQYTARESDPETGLYYYRARYYDPAVSRFLSQDPLGHYASTDSYSYARNNPANLVDALGLTPTCSGCSTNNNNGSNPAIKKLIDDSYKTYEECVRHDLGVNGMLKGLLKGLPTALGASNKAGEKKGGKDDPTKAMDDARKKAMGEIMSALKDCLRKNPLAALACGPDKNTLPPGDVFEPLDPSPVFP